MSTPQKPNVKKRTSRNEQLPTPTSIKRQRALSPLQNTDREDASRTREKIILELRQELAAAQSQARDAAMFKQQRDFAVHIAASLNNLQGDLLEAWYADVQKLAGARTFKAALKGVNEMEDRAVAIEEFLKDFPGLSGCLRARVGEGEMESAKGRVEDFIVAMVEKAGYDSMDEWGSEEETSP